MCLFLMCMSLDVHTGEQIELKTKKIIFNLKRENFPSSLKWKKNQKKHKERNLQVGNTKEEERNLQIGFVEKHDNLRTLKIGLKL